MASTKNVQIFIGNIVHCTQPFIVQTIEQGYVIVENGKILAIDHIKSLESTKKRLNISDAQETNLSKTQLLIPGFVDTHIHAPQYPNIGLGYDMQLLDWLNTYTFPLEVKYKDTEFAKEVYEAVVKRTLSHGTTTACYFATIHPKSALVLCDAVVKEGQRAFVGKVNMTISNQPELIETVEESIRNTEQFINDVLARHNDLLKPIITPRFALSCDMEVMKRLGALAKKYDCHIQTHISENKDEIKAVVEQYGKKYALVYDEAGLLTNKTVLAHGIYLDKEEIALLAQRKTSISHCPSSNTCLQSGLCNVRSLVEGGLSVGLGTDVSGGNSPSVVEAMRSSLTTSIHLCLGTNEKPFNCYEVFYLATLGGAKALTLENKIGNFEVGKDFDALIVDVDVKNSGVDLLEEYKPLEVLQKFIYVGDDRNVLKVFVDGKQVK